MIKTINLQTIADLKDNIYLLDKLKDYLQISLKDNEPEVIDKLLTKIKREGQAVYSDEFYLDFKIPGLSEEFDILKITDNYILNIELKSGNKSKGDMLQQLINHKYYLGRVQKDVYLYTFHAEDDILYKLNETASLEEVVDFSEVIDLLSGTNGTEIDIEEVFHPSKYLVSPFNDTERFLHDEYLLNQSQAAHKETILKFTDKVQFIIGRPGTGKSLLVYDIAKTLISQNSEVKIIHSGNLNNGHNILKIFSYDIYAIKDLNKVLEQQHTEGSILIVDEVQRLSKFKLDNIVQQFKGNIIFSGDPQQELDNGGIGEKLNDFIEENKFKKITLNKKYRSNEAMAGFILGLMDKNLPIASKNIDNNDITFQYFSNLNYAKDYMIELKSKDWKVLALPGSFQYNVDLYTQFNNTFENAFNILGQEFDNVATLVGSDIFYDEKGKLSRKEGAFFSSSKSLYQNVTRTRKKLHLIIVDNPQILDRIVDLLS